MILISPHSNSYPLAPFVFFLYMQEARKWYHNAGSLKEPQLLVFQICFTFFKKTLKSIS